MRNEYFKARALLQQKCITWEARFRHLACMIKIKGYISAQDFQNENQNAYFKLPKYISKCFKVPKLQTMAWLHNQVH